jgi:hypothetical protein
MLPVSDWPLVQAKSSLSPPPLQSFRSPTHHERRPRPLQRPRPLVLPAATIPHFAPTRRSPSPLHLVDSLPRADGWGHRGNDLKLPFVSSSV